jgi:hypothetical protein
MASLPLGEPQEKDIVAVKEKVAKVKYSTVAIEFD